MSIEVRKHPKGYRASMLGVRNGICTCFAYGSSAPNAVWALLQAHKGYIAVVID